MSDWQTQNFKKVGTPAGPAQMNSKLCAPVTSGLHSKIAKPTGSQFSPAIQKFADGGEVEQEAAYKAAGLAASKDESSGLWDRLKAGNIDAPGSDAYNRWGAGRGRADEAQLGRESKRGMTEDAPTVTPAAEETSAPEKAAPVEEAKAPVTAEPKKTAPTAKRAIVPRARAAASEDVAAPASIASSTPSVVLKPVAATTAFNPSELSFANGTGFGQKVEEEAPAPRRGFKSGSSTGSSPAPAKAPVAKSDTPRRGYQSSRDMSKNAQ